MLVAVAVAVASQIVGVLLVFTLLIGPPAIALRFCRTVWPGLALSLAVGIGVTWTSLVLAYLTSGPVSFWAPTLLFVFYLSKRGAYTCRGADLLLRKSSYTISFSPSAKKAKSVLQPKSKKRFR